MKSSIEKLTASERKALVHFYDTAAYKALKRLCEMEISGLGKDALGSPNHEQTKWFGGEASMAAKIPKAVRSLYREHQESEKQKDKERKRQKS